MARLATMHRYYNSHAIQDLHYVLYALLYRVTGILTSRA
jgi:hypothetical protein